MAIDKGLYQAPMGMEAEDASPIEIEIVDPEKVGITADGLHIEMEKGEDTEDFSRNLAEDMDESTLESLGNELISLVDADVSARKDWVDTYVDGLRLLGLKYEETTEPWAGACGVYHPMLSEAVVRFQSEAIMETFPAAGPVKTQIIGKETQAKKEASIRVSEDMNYKLTEQMTEYRPEHEKLLWNLPLAGSAFKKVYYDPSLGRQVSMFIPAEDFIVPYGASNLDTAERMTHVMRKTKNDVKKLQAAGFWRDVELGEPLNTMDDIEKRKAEEQGFTATTDNRYRILEMHVDYNLPGFEDKNKKGEETGVALPYVITVEKSTGKVLAIRRNWYEDDILKLKRIHFVHYQYVPGFGFYGYGLIHLIGGYARSATSIVRQLVDAGTLSNLPGGLKSRGLRVKGDDTPISPGEFRDVDVPSGTIKDNVMLLPYKEPSQTLFQLFNQIVQEGRNFVSAGDLQVSDMGGNAPVGTTLAILERTLKVMSAIQARLHYSMKNEFRLLKVIIADYTPEEYSYEPIEGKASAKKADYDDVDVIPVSDPNASTMAQKIVQYQAVLQLAQSAPQLYNLPLLQNNPQAPQLQAQMLAHVNEHIGFQYRIEIEKQMGMSLPAQKMDDLQEEEDTNMSPELEARLAPMIAQAAQKLLMQNQQQAQAQQAQQQAQDPIIQMQMQELQLKAAEQQRKAAKDAVDAQLKNKQLDIEAQRIKSQQLVAAGTMALNSTMNSQKLKVQQRQAGAKLGIDVIKTAAQHQHERSQQIDQQAADALMAQMQPKQQPEKETK
jgi:hypothetical protein